METISITLASTLIAVLATIYTMQRNSKQDVQQSVTDNVSVREEIKYISKGVEDIKYDTKSLTNSVFNVNERLIRVEEKTKNVSDRLDKHIGSGDV